MRKSDSTPETRQSLLEQTVAMQKAGVPAGRYSVCSAHPFVLETAIIQAKRLGVPSLIESTCNQVNQFGGYTGMTPADFVEYMRRLAAKHGLPAERMLIGGDHLGPYVWRDEPAEAAMAKAHVLVRDCVAAGYTKIHLDASMPCADDLRDRPLSTAVSANRAAELAATAEETFQETANGEAAPRYVIGTEVPAPGGIHGDEDQVAVSAITDVKETIEVTRRAFLTRGLESAWDRVVAVVVQPGVEYGNSSVFDYRPESARGLSRFIEGYEHLIYEAHSTDYQTREGLRQLVRDHFAILKVGPALTFAFREAVFALSYIEEELFSGHPDVELSRIRTILDQAMLEHDVYWKPYYTGTPEQQRLARRYSFSDRSRYYWAVPSVQSALAHLWENLGSRTLPLSLLRQFLPIQYERSRRNELDPSPRALVIDKIMSVLADYAYACHPNDSLSHNGVPKQKESTSVDANLSKAQFQQQEGQ